MFPFKRAWMVMMTVDAEMFYDIVVACSGDDDDDDGDGGGGGGGDGDDDADYD